MKIKVLAAVTVSTVLAASMTFATPFVKVADDMAAPTDTVQTPSLDNNSVSPMPTTPGNEAQGNVGAMNNTAPSPTQLSENGNSSDEMTADAASGEDDF